MKRFLSISLIIILSMTIICLTNNISAQGPIKFDPDKFGNIGDYIEFEILGDNDDIEMTGNFRGELTKDEKIEVKGKSYDCLVMTIKGSGDLSAIGGVKGTWSMSGNVWADKTTGLVVKDTGIMIMKMEYQGETILSTSESSSHLISESSNWTNKEDPIITDSWKIHTISEVITTETMEFSEGKEESTDEETISEVKIYEYIRDETIVNDLGTFNCGVVKSYDEELDYWSDFDYELDFTDKEKEIPIKYETYEDGELVMEMKVIAYSINGFKGGTEVIGSISEDSKRSNTAEQVEGLLGLGTLFGIDLLIIMILIIIIVIILIVVGITLNKKKKARTNGALKESYGEPHSYQRPGGQIHYQQQKTDDYQHQQQYYDQSYEHPTYQDQDQSQKPRSQQTPNTSVITHTSTQPSPQTTHNRPQLYRCHRCRNTLEYVKQYDSWYCDYCQDYQ